MTVEAYYFGCIDRPGHFWWTAHAGQALRGVGCSLVPWWSQYGAAVDGRLCPNPRRSGALFYAPGPQIEGAALIHHKNGWTALSFWDRSVDHRHGCNSNFFLKGTHDFSETVALARESFPTIWARFTFDVAEAGR